MCVQGLGFVGMAMSIAVASACDEKNKPYFNVVGVDLPNSDGLKKIEAINNGVLPLVSNDPDLKNAFAKSITQGNLFATSDPSIYGEADVIVVDIHLDVVDGENGKASASFGGFKKALETLAQYAKPDTLILIETTVPPGTCEKIVVPTLNAVLDQRGLPKDSFHVAHSYERVMPGNEYFKSIVQFWRVYSGITEKAAALAGEFLSKIIDVENYPLTRLHSTTASETAKVLENSYRATNIAFIQEWGTFAERVGVDLFQVLDAIRMRPTHSNIRQPGFGVGGYCLTKDPNFADIGARELFNIDDLDFPFCMKAMETNKNMPLASLEKVKTQLGGSLAGKKILLLGVSYRQDVGDTRYSPSEVFVLEAERQKAELVCHDPLVEYWGDLDRQVLQNIPSPQGFDAVVFAVPHQEYLDLDLIDWLQDSQPVILDANCVLKPQQVQALTKSDVNLAFIGRGIL